jgi:FkbM family methyltransferase
VGANIGTRTDVLLALGASVIAFEPQPQCIRELRARKNPRLTVVPNAVGSAPGRATLNLHQTTTHASLLPNWDGRQAIGAVDIDVTTLDEAIQKYGTPSFCKIDVEGFEPQVLSGLTRAIRSVSFEYHNDASGIQRLKECLYTLSKLDLYQVSYTRDDEASIAGPWRPITEFLMSGPKLTDWGDIFATTLARP